MNLKDWEGTDLGLFEILSRLLLGGTDEIHEKSQS
jgi:hypothetical protein